MRGLIQKRTESGDAQSGGLLRELLRTRDQKRNLNLSDSQISDNIIGVIFAAHDTTASVLTWLLKYLHDNDDLLEAVTVIFSSYSAFFFPTIACTVVVALDLPNIIVPFILLMYT